jgi:hypothetical protein
MTFWALFLSDHKSGAADCFSNSIISFSLPAMSKMLQGFSDPGLKVFYGGFKVGHVILHFLNSKFIPGNLKDRASQCWRLPRLRAETLQRAGTSRSLY